jgi:carboxymethylenebutenolidase
MNKEFLIGGTSVYHAYPDEGHEDGQAGSGKKHPGLIIIEEIWGVTDHIKSVADRFAAEGYSVISPELLPNGLLEMLTPQIQKDLFDPEKRDAVQPKLREAMQPIQQPEYARGAIGVLKACVDYLMTDKGVDAARGIGVVGFCFGGTYAYHLAANDSRIRAAVPFYGQPPTMEEIPNIKCPVLAFYGEQDERLMESLPALKENMAKQGKTCEAIVYSGAGHAFFNDTNPRTYRPDAAADAWNKTIEFLKKNL